MAAKKADGSLLHRQVCLGPPPPNWDDRCTCGSMAVVHKELHHEGVQVPGGICTGRNLSGPCMRCDCTRFERVDVEARRPVHRPAGRPHQSRRRAG